MIAIDMQTAMLANVIVDFVGMVVMSMLWYQNHDKYSGIAYWVLDWILLTGGTVLIALQGSIPPWESIILSNSMIVGGTLALYFGLRLFAGKKNSPLLISALLGVFAVFIAVHSYFTYVHNDLVARSYNASIGLFLTSLLGMWLLLRDVSPQIRRISRGTGISFGMIALICSARIIGFSLLPQTGNQFLLSGKFDTTMVMLLVGSIVFLVFNLVLMVTRRLYIETDEMGDIVSRNAMELQAVFRTTSVGFGIMVNRIFKEVNEAYCLIIGYSREELIGQEVRMVYPTEQEYQAVGQIYPKVAELGAVTTEIRLIRKDGVIINAILNIAAFDKNDLSKGIIFSILDITERKKLEEKSNYLATFPELNPNPILELDQEGNVKYQNPVSKSIFPDIVNTGVNHPFLADWEQVISELQDAHWFGTIIHEIKIGNEYYEQTISAITKTQIRIYARVITERKQVEEALRQSEEKYRLIVEQTLDVIFTTNLQEEFAYVSPSVKNILGYNPSELIGRRFISLVHPEDIPAMAGEIKKSYTVGYRSSVENEYRLRHASGEWRWVISSGSRVVDANGKFIYFIGIIKDITERKQAEVALINSEEKYSTLIEQSIDGILILQNRLVTFANRRMSEMVGYSQGEIIGKYFDQMAAPEYKEMLANEYRRRQAGENVSGNHELEIVAKNNRKIPVETKVQPIVYQEKPAVMVIIRDITERKQAEGAIKESEQNFRNFLDNASIGIRIRDGEEHVLYLNQAFMDIFGYQSIAEAQSAIPMKLYSPQSYAEYLKRSEKIPRGETVPDKVEVDVVRKDGTIRHVQVMGQRVPRNGKIQAQTLYIDITATKQAENALKDSEQRYRSLFENMTDGYAYCRMFYQDGHPVDFQYINVNRAFEKQTGLTGIEGKLVSEVIPGIRESDPELFERYGRVALTGIPESFELFVASLKMWFSISVYSPQNEYFVAIFNVITERKKAEEKILASLAEKETLLKEVHHRVKNNMQVISSLLRLQESKVKDKDSAALLKDSQNRIQSMALVYNKLYQSENLAGINMTDYIKELTAGLVKSYAVNPSRVTVKIAPGDVLLDVDMAIPCGMVINELVTNSLKYAFPDNRKGQISVSLKEAANQKLELIVSDNGAGIPEKIDPDNTSTLGIKLVNNLVRDQLGGKIELDRTRGTIFNITFRRTKEEK